MTRIPVKDAEQERRMGWRFEKRISVDTIVGIVGVGLVIGGPILVWGRAMEARVLSLEVRDDQRSVQDSEQRRTVINRLDKLDEQVTQLRVDFAKIISSASKP